MQHFLKPASRTARAGIVPAKFLKEFLLTMDDAEPRLTLVSDGKPLRRLLLGPWKKVAVHCSLSFQMDLPVTSRKVSCSMILSYPSRRSREIVGEATSPRRPHSVYQELAAGTPLLLLGMASRELFGIETGTPGIWATMRLLLTGLQHLFRIGEVSIVVHTDDFLNVPARF
jgi:hypothetical protein